MWRQWRRGGCRRGRAGTGAIAQSHSVAQSLAITVAVTLSGAITLAAVEHS
jgi:hypothetical protein